MERYDEVKDIVQDVLGEKAQDIQPDTDIVEDLDADSLDLVEVAMAIEDYYGIEIEDEAIAEIHTLDDIVRELNKILGDEALGSEKLL
ncbi:acyl carrier protein [Kallipyga gabonensis]|uniref:acyl carrier protein n=1 Tax=Kallipyga gabonensis TaxID=1686287 RepID=UPI0006B452DA|nr:acyl carrier protein [Kallipyga gabonensis]